MAKLIAFHVENVMIMMTFMCTIVIRLNRLLRLTKTVQLYSKKNQIICTNTRYQFPLFYLFLFGFASDFHTSPWICGLVERPSLSAVCNKCAHTLLLLDYIMNYNSTDGIRTHFFVVCSVLVCASTSLVHFAMHSINWVRERERCQSTVFDPRCLLFMRSKRWLYAFQCAWNEFLYAHTLSGLQPAADAQQLTVFKSQRNYNLILLTHSRQQIKKSTHTQTPMLVVWQILMFAWARVWVNEWHSRMHCTGTVFK